MKHLYVLLLLFISILTAGAQEKTGVEELTQEIDSLFTAAQGDYALAFKELGKEKEPILINEKEEFHAASTMKTPVMIEIFRQAEEGKFSLQDSLTVKNEFRSIVSGKPFSLDINQDSGDGLYSLIGSKVSIQDMMVDMIIHSSNLATNLLIELVDARKVTGTMRKLGAEDILVLRGVEDIEAYEAGLSNTTTAYDLMLIFEMIANGEAVSDSADAAMIEVLLDQKHNDIIPAQLPAGVKVAHKTGSITGVRHDSGIVFLPDGKKYILVLLSKNMEDPEKGVEMMARISRLIYEQVAEE